MELKATGRAGENTGKLKIIYYIKHNILLNTLVLLSF